MTAIIEGNINRAETATIGTVVLNATTSTLIAAANPKRIFFHVNNGVEPDKACWIKLHAASTDNTKHGIVVHEGAKGVGGWEMPADNIYTGEISAIAEATPCTVYVTEY